SMHPPLQSGPPALRSQVRATPALTPPELNLRQPPMAQPPDSLPGQRWPRQATPCQLAVPQRFCESRKLGPPVRPGVFVLRSPFAVKVFTPPRSSIGRGDP